MQENDLKRFDTLDFTFISYDTINQIFPTHMTEIVKPIPVGMSHRASDIMRFICLGALQRRTLLNSSEVDTPVGLQAHKCYNIDIIMLTKRSKRKCNEVYLGFDNLCREAIRRKCDYL